MLILALVVRDGIAIKEIFEQYLNVALEGGFDSIWELDDDWLTIDVNEFLRVFARDGVWQQETAETTSSA